MSKPKTFKDLFTEAEEGNIFWKELAVLDFTMGIERLRKQRGISKAGLARRMGTSAAYITKILRGNANFTLDTMTRIVRALDGKLSVHVHPAEENNVKWFRVVDGNGGGAAAPPCTFSSDIVSPEQEEVCSA